MQQFTKNEDGTIRSLSNRHVQMIAIGGTIGTGLFLGAGSTIAKTGPSILLVYAIMGIFFFFLMRALGEMFYADSSHHTFVSFISKYLGPSVGQFTGWTYWLGLVFLCMSELTAVATYVQYWLPTLPTWAIQVTFLGLLVGINLTAARFFGETEFWFAMIKISAIVALILTGLFMVITATKTPLGKASFANLTHNYTLLPKGPYSFITAFPMVFFAFEGIEFVTITIGEAKNPKQVIKKAVNETLLRILLFYIGALLVIMTIIPWTSLSSHSSPFVQVFQLAGFATAAGIINFVVLISAASALNSSLFSAGRHFYQLAKESTPDSWLNRHFAKISDQGVPAWGILATAALVLLTPLLGLTNGLSALFTIVTGASSDMYIIVYVLALLAHRRYRQSADFDPNGFKMPFYQLMSPLTISFFIAVFCSLFFVPVDFTGALGAVIWTILFGLFTWIRQRKLFTAIN